MLGIYLSMLNSAADQEAFQALYERNKYKVFHAAQGIVKNKLWAEDVVHEGDEIMVKVIEIDDKGRINLSRKALLMENNKR